MTTIDRLVLEPLQGMYSPMELSAEGAGRKAADVARGAAAVVGTAVVAGAVGFIGGDLPPAVFNYAAQSMHLADNVRIGAGYGLIDAIGQVIGNESLRHMATYQFAAGVAAATSTLYSVVAVVAPGLQK